MAIKTLKTNLQSYGQTLKMCKLLLKADSYFNGKDVNTQKINKEISIKSYCYNDDCKTNGERINALTVYIYMEFKKSIRKTDYNTYDECLLMWLSEKLFRIHDKSKNKKDKTRYIDTITLKDAYEKYLKNHKVKQDYWELFDSIKGLKEAYLRYMSEFYLLLNRICKTVVDYKDNGAESNNLSKYSENCLTQYRSLYLSISECKPYLHLLNKLKGIYDDFRVSAIKKTDPNNNLETNLKKLTKPDGEEMNAVRNFISYKIPKKKCYSQKKKPTTPKDSKPNPGPTPQSSESQQTQTPTPLPGTGPPQAQKRDSSSLHESKKSEKNNQSELKDPDKVPENPNGGTGDTGDGALNTGGGKNDKEGSGGSDNGQGAKDSEPGGSGSGSGGDQGGTGGGQKSPYGTGDPGSVSDGGQDSDTGNQGASNHQEGDTGGDKGNQDGSGGTGGGVPTPNEPSSSLPKDLPQSPPGTPHTPKEQTDEPQSPQGPSGKQNSDQNHQEGSKISVINPVVKSENPGTELKGNEITGIDDGYALKKYKKIGISIIVILIPITLTILYKYLSSGWRKGLTRKKNMKKVINSIGGKKQIQIIIKSSNQKKNTKKSINSVYKEKSPSLNVYKIIQADPMPFINLFFLLIFFVYKRKSDFLEL
ncbi:CIR protein PIR protein [Plasmodium vinckei vinckei]|uniref:CIR protein PIR protein n=1 Tax=Plasmodium vinckei vinckei TaxID=54757 RepID=A0A449BND2_PLAVN|nr:CIR protein PIR protein [Plasmodium vinckei vinckei]VEV54912.1 CIR protein PIR protein [Plasmodium vinckei vinckei]